MKRHNFWKGWHWYGRLNFLLLQFLFIRLTKNRIKVIDEFLPNSANFVSGSPCNVSLGGEIKKYHYKYYWSVQYFILPLTGWWNQYVWISTPQNKKITKQK